MEYKSTLNLPRTDFSMKANLTALEPAIIERWRALDIYARLKKERAGSPKYVLHDGPPYANGLIHIGHALNKILKDIVIKFKTLMGYDCPFVIGWDCHGLPVEFQLFKELGLNKHQVEVVDFRKKAKEYALKYVALQADDFKRLGVFSDWDHPYLTLEAGYEYGMMKLLEGLVSSGYVYRGRKPVNWCAHDETALAEAEVEYADKESDSIYVLFKLTQSTYDFKAAAGRDIYFLVWTTTPWTLVSNVAAAVHPDFVYSLVYVNGQLIVLAKDLLPLVEGVLSRTFAVLEETPGRALEHSTLRHPFLERTSPVVLADFVSREEGSGIVHIAPGHGQEDFSLTRKYPLEVIMPVDERGIFQEPAEFKGKNIKEASELVLDTLRKRGALLSHSRIRHSYPHCWRCKNPIIFRATYQWFLNVDHKDLRARCLEEIGKVQWVPASGKERITSMVASRPDWCLSRQRLWGVPIPAVRCGSCHEVILDPAVIARAADVFRSHGSNAWFSENIERFLPQGFRCPHCRGERFEREYDILDVWFESGSSFQAVLKQNSELAFPADLYLEGSDQHRGWFQVSLIPSVAQERRAPFKTILTHGFVVDGEGRKMSKSLGNVVAPQEVWQHYGSEILRLWAASSDYAEDVKISPDIISQRVDTYRKVRNTIRFILGNIHDFSLEKNPFSFDELLEVDRYMAARTMQCAGEVIASYEEFGFYRACQKIFNFCNLDMSSFYLDILKDRLYTFSQNSRQRRSGQFVLYHALDVLLAAIAPVLSFTAEEAYAAWPRTDKKDSVFIHRLDQLFRREWVNEELLTRWEELLAVRSRVLKAIEDERAKGLVGSSLEASVTLKASGKNYERYRERIDTLREIFIVSSVTVEEGSDEIIIQRATGQKCVRCWNFSPSVSTDGRFPDVCAKCVTALTEQP